MKEQYQTAESERAGALGQALNDLPLETPPPALWSAVQTELDQRKYARRQRRFTWISASAVAALLLVAINLMPDPTASPSFVPDTATASLAAELIQARQLSALLEAQLRQNTLRAINASSMDRLLYLENELGWLDTRLASQPNDLSLWQRRIDLLGEMNRQYGLGDWQHDVRLTRL